MSRAAALSLVFLLSMAVALGVVLATYGVHHAAGAKGYIVLEFDDGYVEMITKAAPILKRYGLKASLMIPAGFISPDEAHRRYFYDLDLRHGRRMSFFPTLSLGEVKRLIEEYGWDVQCHSYTHPYLPAFNLSHPIERRNFLQEIDASRRILEEWFGVRVIACTPPYLGLTPEQHELLKKRFVFIVTHGVFTSDPDRAVNSIFTDPSSRQNLAAFLLGHGNFRKGVELLKRLLPELRHRSGVVVILMHRVHEDPRAWDITPQELEELCRLIVELGLRDHVVTYSELADIVVGAAG